MPTTKPEAPNRSNVQAVLAALAKKGIVLPSDFDFRGTSALDVMLAAINSNAESEALAAERKRKADSQKEPDDDNDTGEVREAAMPYSERQPGDLIVYGSTRLPPPRTVPHLTAERAEQLAAESPFLPKRRDT